MYLGGLLHRGSGLAGPDPEAWDALVERIVAALGRPDAVLGADPVRSEPHPPREADPEAM
jgi:hypothetical protein